MQNVSQETLNVAALILFCIGLAVTSSALTACYCRRPQKPKMPSLFETILKTDRWETYYYGCLRSVYEPNLLLYQDGTLRLWGSTRDLFPRRKKELAKFFESKMIEIIKKSMSDTERE
jgi:hypothetical protein